MRACRAARPGPTRRRAAASVRRCPRNRHQLDQPLQPLPPSSSSRCRRSRSSATQDSSCAASGPCPRARRPTTATGTRRSCLGPFQPSPGRSRPREPSRLTQEPLAFSFARRMTIAYFCLASLDLLGTLEAGTTEQERQGWVDWVWAQQLRAWPSSALPGPRRHSLTARLALAHSFSRGWLPRLSVYRAHPSAAVVVVRWRVDRERDAVRAPGAPRVDLHGAAHPVHPPGTARQAQPAWDGPVR